MSAAGIPVIILKEGTGQSKGRDAQRNNIMAAKLIADVVRSSLGPRGMDKMLVDSIGDVTITNDGATILKEIDVQHPAAKMLVEVSKTTDNAVGDGTTSAVVLAGALLEKAEELLEKGVHSTLVVDGYASAAEKALEVLDRISEKISPTDKVTLLKVAKTSLASKLVSDESDNLGRLVVDAILTVADQADGKYKVDIGNVKVEKKAGGSLGDSRLIKGVTLDKEVVHSGMPKRVEGAKIAILNCPLEVEKTEFSAEIRITDPTQMKMFLDEENRMLREMVEKIASAGANVVVTQKGIDDVAQHFLAIKKILAVRRVKESDIQKLARATGGRMVTNIDDLMAEDLGVAGLVEERKIEEDRWTFIEDCKSPKSLTILARGGSQRVVDEAERAIHDALMVVKDVVEKPAIVAGGGSPEAHLAHELRQYAHSLSGREQLAVQIYADALEVIPLALAENAGMDPVDIQVELRAAHSQGKKWSGVKVLDGVVGDLWEADVLEPVSVKEQIIKSATEAACMVLRIDDVIAASKMRAPAGPPGGMPPGGMGM